MPNNRSALYAVLAYRSVRLFILFYIFFAFAFLLLLFSHSFDWR